VAHSEGYGNRKKRSRVIDIDEAGSERRVKKLGPSEELSRELEHLFATFIAEARCPSFEALCSFLQRYPRHAKELIEFAAEWALLTTLKSQGEADDWAIVERKADETIAQLHRLFSSTAR
jgi:hypothetical protein